MYATCGWPKVVTVREAVRLGHQVLAAAGVPSPTREGRRLLSLALGLWPGFGPEDPLAPGVWQRYVALLSARARRVPFPLLEGRTGFLDFELLVCPGVFIPRPETEELAERATEVLARLPPQPRALDLGTGTGALACALARALARVVAVDLDPLALACARQNVRALGLGDRVEVRGSDWFTAVPERFHLIVANPPYVARGEIPRLPPEVRGYEPRLALDGGPDGISAIRAILRGAPKHLLPGGWVLLEIGHGQGEAVLRFANDHLDLVETGVGHDLGGKERFFFGRCR